jgi:hypothetical protein
MIIESRVVVIISLGSVTLALTQRLLGAGDPSAAVGIPNPFEAGGAGMVTVGTSSFFSLSCALIVWLVFKEISTAIKIVDEVKIFLFTIHPGLD